MANPLSQFLTDHFIKPQVDGQVADVPECSLLPAGTSVSAEPPLAQANGQPQNANCALRYSLYKLISTTPGNYAAMAANHPCRTDAPRMRQRFPDLA